jgi:hypothetical protein
MAGLNILYVEESFGENLFVRGKEEYIVAEVKTIKDCRFKRRGQRTVFKSKSKK